MAELFSHTDNDGDVAWLSESGRSHLILRAPRGVELDHAAATALRNALTAWLGGALAPARPAPVTREEVQAMIDEARRSVQPLPLREAAQTEHREAGLCIIPGCHKFPATEQHFEHDPEPVCHDCARGSHPHVFRSCPRPGCGCTDTVPETDPEPGDVGHPRPAADPVDAALADPAVNWSDRLFGKSVPVKVPPQLVGCECGHGWLNHDQTGCTCIQPGGMFMRCKCTRIPPSAP